MSKTVSVTLKQEALENFPTAYKKALTATSDHALCEALAKVTDKQLVMFFSGSQCAVTKVGKDGFVIKIQVPDDFGIYDAGFFREALTGKARHKPSIPVIDKTRQHN